MSVNLKPPVWFWIVGGLLLIWNLMGVAAYLAEVSKTAEDLAAMKPEEAALYANMPAWATAAFAIAVWAGLAGIIALLLRKNWAWLLFALSILGLLVQNYQQFVLVDVRAVYGASAIYFPLVIFAIEVASLWLASWSTRQAWWPAR